MEDMVNELLNARDEAENKIFSVSEAIDKISKYSEEIKSGFSELKELLDTFESKFNEVSRLLKRKREDGTPMLTMAQDCFRVILDEIDSIDSFFRDVGIHDEQQ